MLFMRSSFLIVVGLFFAIVTDVSAQDLPRELGPELIQRIQEGTPTALPQKPIVKRETTDAQDENIKGKVRRVVEEVEYFDDAGKPEARRFSSIEDYDANGHLLKRISFDSNGPHEVTVFGHINGMRVSKYKYVPGAQILSGAMSAEDQALFKATRKADPRFDYEYRYKYENGQLIEMQMFYSDGSAGMRYTYRRTGNEFEELAYGYDKELNQKYVSKLDGRGNEVERLDVAVINQWRGDRKYKIKYEAFDKNGNWTKRARFQVVVEDGKEVLKPWSITYRTLTYHRK
jgi:hypothetical protein